MHEIRSGVLRLIEQVFDRSFRGWQEFDGIVAGYRPWTPVSCRSVYDITPQRVGPRPYLSRCVPVACDPSICITSLDTEELRLGVVN